MVQKSTTYRIISFLLPVVYIFTFLMSPLFHHHHENEIPGNADESFHSHLFDDLSDDHAEDHNHPHDLDDTSKHHTNSLEINSAINNSVKRVLELPIPLTLEFSEFNDQSPANYNNEIEVKPKNKKKGLPKPRQSSHFISIMSLSHSPR